ncbi:hypothetical protein SRHO_G00084120 [Serrasalmus rhombeus]
MRRSIRKNEAAWRRSKRKRRGPARVKEKVLFNMPSCLYWSEEHSHDLSLLTALWDRRIEAKMPPPVVLSVFILVIEEVLVLVNLSEDDGFTAHTTY